VWNVPSRLTQCPPEYQARLTQAGGVNRYGEPLYKLVWGEAHSTRAGGYWEHEGFTGYKDVYLNDTPCWLLLEWHDPIEYGSPTLWYMDNYDEATGLQTLGEFPYKGDYKVLFILRDHKLDNGELVIDPMPLNGMLIDSIIPLMMLGKHISYERRARAIKERRAMEEEEQLRVITDARLDAQMAFGGASFRGRHGAHSDLIAKKEETLRRGMLLAYRQMKQRGMGLSIGD
jgi:hypothetical protein